MSTLAADTITNVAGSSAGTTITIDKDSTYNSEGTAVTQNLVQGLIKVWNNFDGTASGAASRDSFNVSSMTDNTTGTATTAFSNAMANTNYPAITIGEDDSANQGPSGEQITRATGSIKFETRYQYNNTVYDLDNCHVMISGDLA
tara:strand:- start:13793 stop:14227 length:435 start_codon:yes stop_codon:yes gene_type:complete